MSFMWKSPWHFYFGDANTLLTYYSTSNLLLTDPLANNELTTRKQQTLLGFGLRASSRNQNKLSSEATNRRSAETTHPQKHKYLNKLCTTAWPLQKEWTQHNAGMLQINSMAPLSAWSSLTQENSKSILAARRGPVLLVQVMKAFIWHFISRELLPYLLEPLGIILHNVLELLDLLAGKLWLRWWSIPLQRVGVVLRATGFRLPAGASSGSVSLR